MEIKSVYIVFILVSILFLSCTTMTRKDKQGDDWKKDINSVRAYMEARGYSETKIAPVFYRDYIYQVVYYENLPENISTLSSGVENEDGIYFSLEYFINKPDDPNLYAYSFFQINGKKYWFVKINFMLKVTRVMTYVNVKTLEESTRKEFY